MALPAHQKGLELLCENCVTLRDPLVVGDPGRLRQVLVNLLGNAIKFTSSGEVKLALIDAASENGSVVLHFSVSDTGMGISEEWKTRIFDPFVQTDGSNTRRYGGTGLGLTICSRLVSLMGGRIWVESKVGEGSTFHFTAAFRPTVSSGPPTRALEPEVLRGLAVLVVDDNATNRRILAEMLTRWGLCPTLVESGARAIEILQENALAAGRHFALALLDAHMPDMDGFTLASRIQQEHAFDGPRIMLLSSVDVRSVAPELTTSGITNYLVKPVTRSNLLKSILRLLGKHQQPTAVEDRSAGADAVAPLRILLAEDNVVNQKVVVRLLEKQGHSVVVASDGAEALRATGPFDLILMDVQMPVMNGYDATRGIRAREGNSEKHVPIIALTAYAMQGDRELCIAAGMDDYLSKPLQRGDLYAVLERWSRQARKKVSTT